MAATGEKGQEKSQEKTTANNSTGAPAAETNPRSTKIDRNAPAGSENSLGAESIRDGRPNTGDDIVEAIDEEGPGVTPPLP
jgi:hypothetical protein